MQVIQGISAGFASGRRGRRFGSSRSGGAVNSGRFSSLFEAGPI
jgi:hypothetical protein